MRAIEHVYKLMIFLRSNLLNVFGLLRRKLLAMTKDSIIFATLLVFLSPNAGFTLNQVNKNLLLQPERYYIFHFDERILSYHPDNKITRIESVSSIFSDKQELIIKPAKGISTNLTVQTDNNIYKFNISTGKNSNIKDTDDNSDHFMLTLLPLPPKQNDNSLIDSIEIDKPPQLLKEFVDGDNIEIDAPPGVN